MEIPQSAEAQKRVLRGLLNLRAPAAAGKEYLQIQNEYLREELRLKDKK